MTRIDKVLSDLGIASRKEIRQIIRSGRVSVDGIPVTAPESRIDPEIARLTLDGRILAYRKFRYFAMDKPEGVITASEDGKQKTVMDLLPAELKNLDLFPVGRLDKDTSGLLLLTNDGEFAHRVISPKQHVTKEYYAETDGETDAHDAEAFARGITLKDGLVCLPAELIPHGRSCTVIVQEGKYHQVRRMLAAVGKPVTALRRLAIGALRIENLCFENGICELSPPQISQIFIK